MNRDQSDDPLKFLAARLYSAVLAHAMNSAELTPPVVARNARLDPSLVYRVANGKALALPKASTTERLDEAVGANGLLVTIRDLYDQLSDPIRERSRSVSAGPVRVGPWCLDVDEEGRLVAVHEGGTVTVLAGEGG